MLRLSERLNQISGPSEVDETALMRRQFAHQSVLNYVRKLLNVRRGSVAISPSMGMPYVNSFDNVKDSAVVASLVQEIRLLIMKYQPSVNGIEALMIENDQESVIFCCLLSLTFNQQFPDLQLQVTLQADSTYEVNINE